MSESIKYPIIRHLEDEDNLFEKRDGNLLPGQEAQAREIASTLYSEILDKDASILLLVTSPKKRAIQTAEMVAKDLQPRTRKIHIIRHADKLLTDQYQGELILPGTYKAGDNFEGLAIAKRIFEKETFGDADSPNGNVNYHFGDPLLQENGTYTYPELREYFSKSGESYRDVFIRLLSALLGVSKNVGRFKDEKVFPVIFTHSQAKQIFKDLETLAEQHGLRKLNYKTGQLGKICWDMYKKRKAENPHSDTVDYITVDALLKAEVVGLLQNEVAYLKNL